MPNDRRRHYRLTLEDALEAHEHALRFGGRPGVVNRNSIESAIARPYSGYCVSIRRKAAALVLLGRSRYRLTPSDKRGSIQRETQDMVLAVARKQLSFNDLTLWFGERITHA